MTFTTRFAPSPTGPLHLGHAFSAILGNDLATANGGRFLLRIEDIDQSRARPHWETQIYDDLHWLGVNWPEPVMRQSDRMEAYATALDRLWGMGVLYPCTCTRRDIQNAMSAPQEGVPQFGPDGPVYPGTCRPHPDELALLPKQVARPITETLRLDMRRAWDLLGTDRILFQEEGAGPDGETGEIETTAEVMHREIGDVVLARKGMATSYHLSVVVDDAAQDITHVVRGQDLFEATRIHVLLQKLLGLPVPKYRHHRLIRDESGKRLAKRDDARAIATYREDGASPSDIRRMIGL